MINFVHIENYDLQKYSFQKLTQFLQGNNVLDSNASNTDP
jgi:3-hydroxyacyl-CoA dehydrogenase